MNDPERLARALVGRTDWRTDDQDADRLETYVADLSHGGTVVAVRWTYTWVSTERTSGYACVLPGRAPFGVKTELPARWAEVVFRAARACWVRARLGAYACEWFEKARTELTAWDGIDKFPILSEVTEPAKSESPEAHEARRRLAWVADHVVTHGVAYDDMAVRNNIGKACAALGITTPVGFF